MNCVFVALLALEVLTYLVGFLLFSFLYFFRSIFSSNIGSMFLVLLSTF